jgi:hypothetical protein
MGWLALAFVACAAGFGWLALAMDVHWQQVHAADDTGSRPQRRALRMLGIAGLVVSLWACLRADHPSIAALVWVLMLAAAAALVAFTLAWRPRWLSPLAACVRWMPVRP